MYELKSIPGGAQIFFVAQHEICLHRGTKSIHVAVGVLAGKYVLSIGERTEIILFDETNSKIAILFFPAAAIRKEQILR